MELCKQAASCSSAARESHRSDTVGDGTDGALYEVMRIEVNEWQYKVDYTSIRTKGREPDTDGSLVFIGDIMATKSLKFCRHRGCGELTPSIYCDKHQAEYEAQRIEAKARYDELRGTATQRE